MWLIVKSKFKLIGPLVLGGNNPGREELVIDRVIETLDDAEPGEMFVKCNVKK